MPAETSAAVAYNQLDADDGRRAMMSKREFISIKSGLYPEQNAESWTHERELDRLCPVIAKQEDTKALRRLLEVAAVGLDGRSYQPVMSPILVRGIGEKHLAKTSTDVRAMLLTIAESQSAKAPIRIAALRALGSLRDELCRPQLEGALADRNKSLRRAAATAIALAELKTAVPALANQLANEKDTAARVAMIDALTAIAKEHCAGA